MAPRRLDEPAFNDERTRFRVALGITHDPSNASEIFREIREYHPEGFVGERGVVAIASKRHLGKYSEILHADDSAALPVLIFDAGRVDTGLWRPKTPAAVRFRDQLQTFEHWMAPNLAARLKNHLENSDLVVAVALPSPEQEQVLCQILLRRAVDHLYVQDLPTFNA